jgi:hypothetical protein
MNEEKATSDRSVVLYGASNANDDPFILVATNNMPTLTEVRLYDSTLNGHIFQDHPEVEIVGRAGIVDAIENPSYIIRSNTRPDDSVVHVTEKTTFNGLPLHVPVKIIMGTSGRVSSSYFAETKSNAIMLWPKK